jgi:ACR3 family arsenite transporter
MILPMMIQIDFKSVLGTLKAPVPIIVSSVLIFGIVPFTNYGLGVLFFKKVFVNLGEEKANEFLMGTILLAGAPCTAMVFVWSVLLKGNASYTLTQVAVDNILLLILYVPTTKFLGGFTSLNLPWSTLLISVAFFVAIPLILGIIIRQVCLSKESWNTWLNTVFIPILDRLSMVFLVLMVILIFISQAASLVGNVVDILIISVPLLFQTGIIWTLSFSLFYFLKISYDVAAPASLITSSNFFEMAVAVSVALFGAGSNVTLATVVGVLIEVPVMLGLISLCSYFKYDMKAVPEEINTE